MQKIKTISIFIISFFIVNSLSLPIVFANSQNEFTLEDVKILVDETTDQDVRISISTKQSSQKVTAELVQNPTRIVFDIFNFTPRNAKNLNINSPLFKKIRVGLHKDKTRIVFDCATDSLSNLSDESNGNNYSFTISGSKKTTSKKAIESEVAKEEPVIEKEVKVPVEVPSKPIENKVVSTSTPLIVPTKLPTIEPTIAPTLAPTLAPTAIETVKTTPTPTLEIKNVPVKVEEKKVDPEKSLKKEPISNIPQELVIDPISPEENETITDVEKKLQAKIDTEANTEVKKSVNNATTTKVEPNVPKTDSESLIKSIVFQTTAEQMQSSMVVSTTAPINYSINRTSKTSFELVIPGTKLKGDHLKLPQFPPDSFKGFLYFQASEVEGGVTIKIEVEEAVNLSPYFALGKLWIKAE